MGYHKIQESQFHRTATGCKIEREGGEGVPEAVVLKKFMQQPLLFLAFIRAFLQLELQLMLEEAQVESRLDILISVPSPAALNPQVKPLAFIEQRFTKYSGDASENSPRHDNIIILSKWALIKG